MKHTSPTKKGFTLIETLVAVFLLTLASVSASLIAQKALQASLYSRDETTAYYLAAEGIELVKNVRDNNGPSAAPTELLAVASSSAWWLNGLQYCTSTSTPNGPKHCEIDPYAEIVTACGAVACKTPLLLTASSTLNPYEYNYSSGNSSGFVRDISIVTPAGGGIGAQPDYDPDDEAIVTSSVTWKTGIFSTRTITLQENISNWH